MGRNVRGVTLPELVAVVLMIGILSALAAPSFSASLARMRTRAALNTLSADVAYTRSLAVRNGQRAVLRFAPSPDCPGTPGFRPVHAYRVVLPGTPERVARDVSLRDLAPALCLEVGGSDSVAFNSRGLLTPLGNRKVRARSRGAADSLTISSLGRVYRRF